jgi:hypothetical protein
MYALASALRGFASSTLRVRVVREDERYAWVVTADLLDAGTPLTIDRAQLAVESDAIESVRHVAGLVSLGGI